MAVVIEAEKKDEKNNEMKIKLSKRDLKMLTDVKGYAGGLRCKRRKFLRESEGGRKEEGEE